MRGRIEAFENLMGVAYPLEECPARVTLPEYVHQKTLNALSETVQDSRERSMRFSYRKEKWCGGLAMRGTKFEDGNARASELHKVSTVIFPPHVYMHTHPDVTAEQVDRSVEMSQISGVEPVNLPAVVRQIIQIIHRTPSDGDVFRAIHEPAGSVGQLLVSSYGIFAWVHKNLATTKGIRQSTFSPQYRRKMMFARQVQHFVAEADEAALTNISSIESLAGNILQTRAQALDSAYFCYSNEDPENPALTKAQ